MKILIAGAGHGGLVAGAILARAGHSVTVVEQNARAALGHDWEDRFAFSLLTDVLRITQDELPPGSWRDRGDCTFVSPNGKTHVDIHFDANSRQRVMWRKPLLAMLLAHAETCGVRFLFETQVTAPLLEGSRVIGLRTQDVDFLFASRVVESGDLAGGGQSVNVAALLGKLCRGMKKPPAFFAVINGMVHGSRAAALYKKAPEAYSSDAVTQWDRNIARFDLPID